MRQNNETSLSSFETSGGFLIDSPESIGLLSNVKIAPVNQEVVISDDMANWTQPLFSRGQIDRAGKTLISSGEVLDVVEAVRSNLKFLLFIQRYFCVWNAVA